MESLLAKLRSPSTQSKTRRHRPAVRQKRSQSVYSSDSVSSLNAAKLLKSIQGERTESENEDDNDNKDDDDSWIEEEGTNSSSNSSNSRITSPLSDSDSINGKNGSLRKAQHNIRSSVNKRQSRARKSSSIKQPTIDRRRKVHAHMK